MKDKYNGAKNVLIVEDDAIISNHLESIITEKGFKVIGVAASGKDAIKKANERSPDLILMDINLNGKLSGIDAAKQIRSTNDIPIIYLSAYSDISLLEQAADTTPHGYLIKPIREQELIATVKMALHRHQIESKIKVQEQWFNTLLRSIGDGVIATNREGNVTYLNSVAEKLTGWTNQDAIGKNFTEIYQCYSLEDNSIYENPVELILKSEQPAQTNLRSQMISKTGEKFIIGCNASPIIDEQKNLAGAVIVFRNLTKQIRAENISRENELRYRALFENHRDIVLLFNMENELIAANHVAVQSFGYDLGEMIGMHVKDLVIEGEYEKTEKQYQRMLEGDLLPVYERLFKKKNGTILPGEVNVSLVRDFQGNPLHIQSIIRDITTHKLTSKALFKSEERYRNIIEGSGDAVYLIDTKGVFEYVNPKAETITGYSRKELIGMHFTNLIPEEWENDLVIFYNSQIENEIRETYMEFPILQKSGDLKWVGQTVNIMFDEGKITGMQSVVRDISVRKEAQIALSRKVNELALIDIVRTALSSELDISELSRIVVESISETFGYEYISIYLREGDKLIKENSIGFSNAKQSLEFSEGIIGRVARLGLPEFVDNIQEDPDYVAGSEGIIAEICVPLKVDNEVIGILNIESDIPGQLSSDDLRLAQDLSEYINVAVKRSKLFAAEREQRALSESLTDISAALSSTLDIEEVFSRILNAISRVVPHQSANIMLINDGIARIVSATGYIKNDKDISQEIESLQFDISKTPDMQQMLDTRKASIVSDTISYPAWKKTDHADLIRSHMAAPIQFGDNVIGFLNIDSPIPNYFFPEHASRLEAFTNQAAIAIHNAQLFEQLEKSQKSLANAQKTASLGSFEWDPQTNTIIWSDEMYNIFGVDNHTFIPSIESFRLLLHPEDSIVERLNNFSIENSNEIIESEFRIIDQTTKQIKQIQLRGNKVSSDQRDHPGFFTGTMQDVTHIKEAEQSLRESEEKYRTLFETSADGILIVEVNSRKIQYANPAICKLLGYEESELLQKSATDLLPHEKMDFMLEIFRNLIQGKSPNTNNIPLVSKNKSIIFTDVAAATADIDGKKSIIGFFRDTTAKREAQKLALEQAHAISALQERQRLARDLHDVVSQTLFSAKVISETLPRLWESDQIKVRSGLDDLQRLTRGALAEMRTLLMELRPEALANTNLPTLLRQLADGVTGRTTMEVDLQIDFSGELPSEIKMAVFRTAQECLNNVVKHSRATTVNIFLEQSSNSVSLTIKDNGIGFSQSKVAPDRMGLSIMQERIENINGKIEITSIPKKGTTTKVHWETQI